MSVVKRILLCILISSFVSDACSSYDSKHKTSSQTFLKLRADQTTRCQFINRDFHKLRGDWYYVLRTVASRTTPKMRCGHLAVTDIFENGFIAMLDYMADDDQIVKIPINGVFLNETVFGIPDMSEFVNVDPMSKKPYTVQMGICDNDTVLFIEPIHYIGGAMVFTRNIPKSLTALKLRFGTYDEQRGKELMMPIALNCTAQK